MKKTVLIAVALCFCLTAFATSVITSRLEDPKAIYFDRPVPTGYCSGAILAAIYMASGTVREGIVFVA